MLLCCMHRPLKLGLPVLLLVSCAALLAQKVSSAPARGDDEDRALRSYDYTVDGPLQSAPSPPRHSEVGPSHSTLSPPRSSGTETVHPPAAHLDESGAGTSRPHTTHFDDAESSPGAASEEAEWLPASPVSSTDSEGELPVPPYRRPLKASPALEHLDYLGVEPWVVQNAMREREFARSPIDSMTIHPIPLAPNSALERRALDLLEQWDNGIAHFVMRDNGGEGRIPVDPQNLKRYSRRFLMKPAPVSESWYRMMHLAYTDETVREQPMLFYEFNTRARAEHDHIRFLGVAIVDEQQDHQDFMRKWQSSNRIFSWNEFLNYVHRFEYNRKIQIL